MSLLLQRPPSGRVEEPRCPLSRRTVREVIESICSGLRSMCRDTFDASAALPFPQCVEEYRDAARALCPGLTVLAIRDLVYVVADCDRVGGGRG